MSQQKSPSEDLLYRPHMSSWWWVRQKNYFLFMVRELSAVFVGLFALISLVGVYRLSQGQEAYQAYLSALQSPSAQLVFVVILLFSIFHSVTWIHLTPMIMVVRVGSKTVPPGLVLLANYLAWIAISVILFYLLVSSPMNTVAFADGACEGRSRSEEEAMSVYIGDDKRHRDRPQPPLAQRVAAGRHRFLCRELDAVALATNATVFMGRDTHGDLIWR